MPSLSADELARPARASRRGPWHLRTLHRASSCIDLTSCSDPIWFTGAGELPNLGEPSRPLLFPDVLAYAGRWGRAKVLPGTSAPFGPFHHRGTCVDGRRSCSEPPRRTLVARP